MWGVVNNAVYQNYLEHTRHQFMKAAGVDVADSHAHEMVPMVTRVEIDYKSPLRSGDRFAVCLSLRRQGRLRFIFDQEVVRIPDRTLCARAVVTAVIIQNGRPVAPDEIVDALLGYSADGMAAARADS
jgi:acyl-CoA thioester hydrolase